MHEDGITFQQAVNDAIRASERSLDRPFQTETASMGEPVVNLDRSLQTVADLEDDDLIRELRSGS
jgi:hypothetical protein